MFVAPSFERGREVAACVGPSHECEEGVAAGREGARLGRVEEVDVEEQFHDLGLVV